MKITEFKKQIKVGDKVRLLGEDNIYKVLYIGDTRFFAKHINFVKTTNMVVWNDESSFAMGSCWEKVL